MYYIQRGLSLKDVVEDTQIVMEPFTRVCYVDFRIELDPRTTPIRIIPLLEYLEVTVRLLTMSFTFFKAFFKVLGGFTNVIYL